MKVMLDLETLSTEPNAAIISIGAVAFTEEAVSDQRLYAIVKANSITSDLGRDVSMNTVVWWMGQSDEARSVFSSPMAVTFRSAIDLFTKFCQIVNVDEMWGNGSDFDNVVLGNSYHALGLRTPWKYSQNRCFRTLKSLVDPEIQNALWNRHNIGVQHNALDDAVRQAKMAVEIFKILRGG